MRFLRGTAALAVCVAGAATGCVPASDTQQVDAETDATADADLDAPDPPGLGPEWALRAIEVLDEIENGLPNHLINGRFPEGTEASTPSATCCAAGGVFLCEPNPAAWEGGPGTPTLWDQLGVRIAVPHAYVYSASSVGGYALTISADGDLDCDGTIAELRLDCTLTNGAVSCTLDLPDVLD